MQNIHQKGITLHDLGCQAVDPLKWMEGSGWRVCGMLLLSPSMRVVAEGNLGGGLGDDVLWKQNGFMLGSFGLMQGGC